ncbi:hypothetical protein ID866_5802 [Astraeus odoratus]|nr:hypothetical protein ID866_5802 [Astraeus odoratus]
MSTIPTPFIHFRIPNAALLSGEDAIPQSVILHDFTSLPTCDGPLVPPHHQWPTFDTAVVYAPSPTSSPTSSCQSSPSPAVGSNVLPDSSSTFPSSADLANMPVPPSRGTSRNKSPYHIPRPRNAFMLFRSAFSATQKITTNIEHDNRHITRIIAHCWNRLPEEEKQVWRDKAAAEKADHAAKYPNYRFTPVCRANKPLKRNVRRNGIKDKKRCEKVAELLLAGKHGDELADAVKQIDISLSVEASARTDRGASPSGGKSSPVLRGWQSEQGDSGDGEIRPFRSPLLPPTELRDELSGTISLPVNVEVSCLQCPTFDTTQASHAPAVAHVLPRTESWGYYRTRDGISPLEPTSIVNQYQPFVDYTHGHGRDLSPPDFSGFSWGDESFSSASSSSSSSSSYL